MSALGRKIPIPGWGCVHAILYRKARRARPKTIQIFDLPGNTGATWVSLDNKELQSRKPLVPLDATCTFIYHSSDESKQEEFNRRVVG